MKNRNEKRDPSVIMEAFQQGSESAFHELYDEFKRPIFFFIMGMTKGQEELSEELTHEAFLRLYKNRDQFNHSVKFTTWFWTIARNLTIDELRKKNPLDWTIPPSHEEVNSVEHIKDTTQEIESLLLDKAQKEELYHGINQLKPRQKEVVLLRISSELSYEEIGGIMKIGPGAVKALFMRAKKNLETALQKNQNKNLVKVAT